VESNLKRVIAGP